MKRILTLILTILILFSALGLPAWAKTQTSAAAENVFVYATDRSGRSVLLKVIPFAQLKSLAHGDTDGGNYFVSSTDNYPTTQYCEGRGFTVRELLDYVKAQSSVSGTDALGFTGSDTLRLMATDSYGNYSRSWTYDELYGVKRYYFADMYGKWNTGWEVAGEENSKQGISLAEYKSKYQSKDSYYKEKRTVFASGVETKAVFMTESFSGRTTTESLVASTEPGIAGYISANGGKVTGCLKNALTEDCALRLAVPMTEADLMSGHRTAFDSFKWVYNLQFDCSTSAIKSLGTVAEAVPAFSLSGSRLTVTLQCATAGASIYYGFDGAPQTLYTGPFTVDVSGRDLDSNPITVYATAVKEGYDDAGVLTFKYPGMAPGFQTLYTGVTGSALTFTAADSVSTAEWSAWTKAMSFITLKAPGSKGYVNISKSKYSFDNTARTVTFDKSLFTASGSYSFVFHAVKFADKSASVTLKAAAPTLSVSAVNSFGSALTIRFSDSNYQSGLSVYVTPENGSRTMISGNYLDRTKSGEVTIKADYFTASSTAMAKPGVYTLELTNNSYSPASQTVTVTLTASGAVSFTDVPAGAWYAGYVTELAGAGIINGVGKGRFDPDGILNYGQAMKLLLLSCGYGEQAAPAGAHWAVGYMDKAAAEGLIPASTDPDAAISRLRFCQTAAKAVKLKTDANAGSPFSDTDDATVLALNKAGIISGMGDGTFAPNETLTRAQISKIIWCIRNMEDPK